ncbi:hypothetical protein ACS0TY_004502 [Phlomoides rotata]
MRALDNLGLGIQQAVISCFNGFALDVFRAEVHSYFFEADQIPQSSLAFGVEQVKSSSAGSRPTALITTAEGRYFSIGYHQLAKPKILSEKFRLLMADLISLSMPTITAVNGNAYGAGLILALSHDYVHMSMGKGRLWLNELDFKNKIPNWYMSILKSKIGNPTVRRDLVLKPTKLNAYMASIEGVVNSMHESVQGTVDAAVYLGKKLANWDGEVYASNRRTVFSDVVAALGSDETVQE